MCQLFLSSNEITIYNNHDVSRDCVLYSAVVVKTIAEIAVNICFDLLLGSLFKNFCCFADSD